MAVKVAMLLALALLLQASEVKGGWLIMQRVITGCLLACVGERPDAIAEAQAQAEYDAACLALCISGLGGAALMLSSLGCLSDSSTVLRLDGAGIAASVPIWSLRPGDEVLTMVAGEYQPTRIVQNRRHVGNFSFVRLDAATATQTFRLEMTVDHVAARFANSSVPAALAEGQMQALLAGDLRVGDEILVAGGGAGARARVVELQRAFLPAKNTLVTASGTVVANGVYATTVCGAGEDYIEQPNLEVALSRWKWQHAAFAA